LGLEPRLAEAVEGITSLVGKDTLRWYARLWDPVAGALYYSNSGRDYEGFGPDLESTKQMISVFMDFSTVNHPAGFIGTMPEDIKEKMISFVDSCLDEDGYFYHPQWGKNIGASRRGRDLTWATKLYSWLGAKPPHPTALDLLGEKKTAAGSLPEHLTSKKKFYAYLEQLPFEEGKSWNTGNLINAQMPQIKAAGLENALCNFLDSAQNPENGIWEKEINYRSLSGLMKIMASYIFASRPLRHVEAAVSSVFSMIRSEVMPEAMTYIYNPISALSQIMELERRVGNDYYAAKLNGQLHNQAVEVLDNSQRKLEIFHKPDGSFSYCPTFSAHRSQNVPVALWHENEGDVNATSIAIGGVINGILYNLGIDYKIFDDDDIREFWAIVKAQRPIVKKPVPEGRFK